MYSIILSFLTAFFISFIAIPSIKNVAAVKHLYDEPGGRKRHKSSIPTLGGVAIFAGLIFSFTYWSAELVYHPRQYIVSAILILFFIGIKDDIIPIPPLKKLIGQLIAAAIIAVSGGIRITSMHDLLGINQVSLPISIALTIFTIIVIINSFNLIDGIDGLAAGIGVIVALTFGFMFLAYGEVALTILAFSLSGALLGFLYYNFNPAKIFMGDTGSLVVGLVISVLTINFIELKPGASNYSTSLIVSGPAFAITLLIIPLFDTLRVFCIRIFNKKSPFSADRNHIHHELLAMGLSHKSSAVTLYVVNIMFIFLSLYLRDLSSTLIILIVFGLALLLSFIPRFVLSRKVIKRYNATKKSVSV